jgi:hypothetical protein
MRNWDNTVTGLRSEPDPALLETLFLRQIRKCVCLAHPLARYGYAKGVTTETGEIHVDATYRFLYKTVKAYLSQKLDESQRAEELGAIADGRSGIVAAALAQRTEGERIGRAAATARGGAKPVDGRAPKGPTKGNAKTAEEKAVTPCSFFANGNCKKGEECDWSHAESGQQTPLGDGTVAKPRARSRPARKSVSAAPLAIRAAIAAASLLTSASSIGSLDNINAPHIGFSENGMNWLEFDRLTLSNDPEKPTVTNNCHRGDRNYSEVASACDTESDRKMLAWQPLAWQIGALVLISKKIK